MEAQGAEAPAVGPRPEPPAKSPEGPPPPRPGDRVVEVVRRRKHRVDVVRPPVERPAPQVTRLVARVHPAPVHRQLLHVRRRDLDHGVGQGQAADVDVADGHEVFVAEGQVRGPRVAAAPARPPPLRPSRPPHAPSSPAPAAAAPPPAPPAPV